MDNNKENNETELNIHFLEEIKKKDEELKQKIEKGEIKVCDSNEPECESCSG